MPQAPRLPRRTDSRSPLPWRAAGRRRSGSGDGLRGGSSTRRGSPERCSQHAARCTRWDPGEAHRSRFPSPRLRCRVADRSEDAARYPRARCWSGLLAPEGLVHAPTEHLDHLTWPVVQGDDQETQVEQEQPAQQRVPGVGAGAGEGQRARRRGRPWWRLVAAVPASVVVVVPPPAAVVVVVPDPGVGAGTKAIGTVTLGSVELESPNESVQVSPAACCAAVGGQG